MIRSKLAAALLASVVALTPLSIARGAGIPVIDVTAIAQLTKQVEYWLQQIQLMQNQLNQLQQAYSAITGPRGMENLLAGTARNYLPQDWNEMLKVLNNTSNTYSGLSWQVQAAITANAVLSTTQLGAMTPQQRQFIADGRSAAAMLQVLTQAAYQNTSQRFAAIQQLINVLATAGDQKAGPAGAGSERTGNAAERADQIADAVPGCAGTAVGPGATNARRGHKLDWQLYGQLSSILLVGRRYKCIR